MGGLNSPSETEVARTIRDAVEAWRPRRGPDWQDLMRRAAATGPSAWMVYSVASVALVLILLTAFVVGSELQIGALAPQPINSNLH